MSITNAQPALIRAFFASFAEGILSADAEKETGTVDKPVSFLLIFCNI